MSPPDDEALRRLRHDLRSPLVVVDGFAALLASDRPVDDATRRDFAQRIRNAAADLQRIMDEALGD